MKSDPANKKIEDNPIEWDFRWVASEQEVYDVYHLELAREAIRRGVGGLALGLHGGGLARFAGVGRHTVTVSQPRVGVNRLAQTIDRQPIHRSVHQSIKVYLVGVYIRASAGGWAEYYFLQKGVIAGAGCPLMVATTHRSHIVGGVRY
jgi:hypothetical protein